MSGCVFCELMEDPSAFADSNRRVLVVKDSNPKAETHLLVIPRQHVERLDEATIDTLAAMHMMVKKVVRDRGLDKSGYRLIVNVGEGGKQKVPHLHFHVLAGPEVLADGFARGVE